MEKCIYWIWLQMVLGYCNRRSNALIDAYEHPKEIYDAIHAGKLAGVLLPVEAQRARDIDIGEAQKTHKRCMELGHEVITPDHELYPRKLLNINALPCALYVIGDIGGIDETLTLGMVGTRNDSEYGRAASRYLSEGLARSGAVVVSGLATGIDAQCHKGALNMNSRTIAVIGCGLDIDYPPQNTALKQMITQHGAVISEYPPGTQPRGEYFPIRNRIISGISDGVVVIEAGKKSGALITASYALSHGRDLFVVPSDIFDIGFSGSIMLLRQGAKPVATPLDVLEDYIRIYPDKINTTDYRSLKRPVYSKKKSYDAPPCAVAIQPAKQKKEPPKYLDDSQMLIYKVLGHEPKNLEIIIDETGISLSEALSVLTQLEILGLAVSHPGRRYSV